MTDFIPHPSKDGHFIRIVHPSIWDDIRKNAARDAYYHASHVERWERRYGKPYPEPEMYVGTWRGMTFVDDR